MKIIDKIVYSEVAPLNTTVIWLDNKNNLYKFTNGKWRLIGADEANIKALIEESVAGLVDAAPDQLNTLKELSEALNNDADFASNITTQLTTINSQLSNKIEWGENTHTSGSVLTLAGGDFALDYSKTSGGYFHVGTSLNFKAGSVNELFNIGSGITYTNSNLNNASLTFNGTTFSAINNNVQFVASTENLLYKNNTTSTQLVFTRDLNLYDSSGNYFHVSSGDGASLTYYSNKINLTANNSGISYSNNNVGYYFKIDGSDIFYANNSTGNNIQIAYDSITKTISGTKDTVVWNKDLTTATDTINTELTTIKEDYNKLLSWATENGYDPNPIEFVDLGLPSGTLWAKTNLGAETEYDAGLYFQWGDTVGYTADQVGSSDGKKVFSWDDYKYGTYDKDDTDRGMTKYNKTDSLTTLDSTDDSAIANMGTKVVMPNQTQFQELIDNTTQEYSSENGGYIKFISKTDTSKYIILPASGSAAGGGVNNVGNSGSCWSSSLSTLNVSVAWGLSFNVSGEGVRMGSGYRYYGRPVRPVYNPNQPDTTIEEATESEINELFNE